MTHPTAVTSSIFLPFADAVCVDCFGSTGDFDASPFSPLTRLLEALLVASASGEEPRSRLAETAEAGGVLEETSGLSSDMTGGVMVATSKRRIRSVVVLFYLTGSLDSEQRSERQYAMQNGSGMRE